MDLGWDGSYQTLESKLVSCLLEGALIAPGITDRLPWRPILLRGMQRWEGAEKIANRCPRIIANLGPQRDKRDAGSRGL